ncbi:hypothetical protein J437_LFUL018644 [Ladona fulva]|uniref:Uncharacterized protein n=1 Tax=Ladona fulva TaxID=123851 RepID=A0A8K0KP51_LADFU|nr:hypothetical protein J437_LFUL018644 [Ladona fulva]
MQRDGIQHHGKKYQVECFEQMSLSAINIRHHKNHSHFEDIPGIDMVRHFPYDYMHLACLGVMRKMLFLFMTGPLLVRLQSSAITQLCEKLESIGVYISLDFARKPKGV